MPTLQELIPDPKNRRTHTPRNVEILQESIEKVGTARSIVIDEDDVVLAGNATVKAAGLAGLTKLRVVEADGDEVIAVRRRGLTSEQKRDLSLYDNRTAELAEWDAGQLLEDANNNVDLSAFFYDEELQSILDGAEDIDLDQFFEPNPNTNQEGMLSLVLKFSSDQHRDVLKALESYGKSPEQAILQVLGIA
jgi:ParB-like chromosome segregation protein Spo0J